MTESNATDTLLNVQGLSKSYADFTLSDVDLSVESGCVTGFIGGNGAGKTTTIKVILGLIEPDGGTIELFGQCVSMESAAMQQLKQRIGVVFDTCAFPREMTVGDVGALGRAAFTNWDAPLFERLTREFELGAKKNAGQLSRGMGMKLTLAFAMAHHPALLILDEPTAGLDPMARDGVLDMLRAFMAYDGHGILMSSHITSDLEKIADRIVCIDRGRIAFDMPKDEISDMAGIAHCRTAEFEAIAEPGMRSIRREYGVDLLVSDRFAFSSAHPDIAVDKAGIDDYMALILKGETR